jgi:hypothetical protein
VKKEKVAKVTEKAAKPVVDNKLKGLAGGVKIGASIKSKLIKKPSVQKETPDAEVKKKILSKDKDAHKKEPVAKAETKKPEPASEPKKLMIKKKTEEPAPEPKKLVMKKKQEPVEEKPEPKKVLKLKPKKDEAETAEITPAVKKAAITKPVVGIKRPMGGLAASLKKMN